MRELTVPSAVEQRPEAAEGLQWCGEGGLAVDTVGKDGLRACRIGGEDLLRLGVDNDREVGRLRC